MDFLFFFAIFYDFFCHVRIFLALLVVEKVEITLEKLVQLKENRQKCG